MPSYVLPGGVSGEPRVRPFEAVLELGPQTFVVRATGDALAPDVCDGEVQVDSDVPVKLGQAVALRHGGAGRVEVLRLVEEYGCLLLGGTRPGVSDRVLDAEAEADILGVAAFRGRAV